MPSEVRFVRYDSKADNHPKQTVLSLEEFFLYLGEHAETDCAPCKKHDCSQKDGLAWGAGWIPQGKTRKSGHVESFDVVGFDFDHQTKEGFEALCARLDEIDCLVYSTHSHSPPGEYAVRVVCSLSRRLMARDYLPVWHAVVRKFALQADPRAKDPSRLFFMPSCVRGASRINIRNAGKPLDVDQLLSEQLEIGLRRRVSLVDPEPIQLGPGEVDLGGLKGYFRRYMPNANGRAETVRRLLTGKPLAEKGDRDEALWWVAQRAGRLFPAGTPVEAAMEVLRPAIVSMPQEPGDLPEECPEGWMKKAQAVYEKAAEQRQKEFDENQQGAKLLVEVVRERERKNGMPPLSKALPPDTCSDESDDDTWRDLLKCKHLKDGSRVPEPIKLNAVVVLEHHPAWKTVLRFNEITKNVDSFGGPLPIEERTPPQLLCAIECWLQKEIGLNLNTDVVKSALLHVARRHAYDPVAEHLHSLPAWNGEPRLNGMLERYFGARCVEGGYDVTGYIRAVSAWFLIAAVARALQPGCKVDNVFVFEGGQGSYKSTALEVLSGGWFTELHLDLNNKDTRMLIGRNWFIELAELSSLRKSEVEAQKAFFSQRIDQFRPPYGHVIEDFPRHCICAGTTNDDDYFHDSTGNRRFLPVYCEAIDVEALRRDRGVLFAEALYRYEQGERWWPTPEESAEIETILNRRLNASGYDGAIFEWWRKIDPDKRPSEFTMMDVVVEALGLPKHMVDVKNRTIGRALKKLGFIRKRKRDGDDLHWVYEPSEELKIATKVESRLLGHLRVLSGGKSDTANEAKGNGT